jgi:hypothetical protein
MPIRAALRSVSPWLSLCAIVSCTKGAGLIEGFGSSYTVGGDAGQDTGDDESDDEGLTGPVDDDGGGDDPPSDDGPSMPGTGDCCVGHDSAGCSDAAIESCVCAQDSFCCDMTWDDLCASLVVENMCGVCDDPSGESDGGDDQPPDPSTDGGGETGGGETGVGETGAGDGGESDDPTDPSAGDEGGSDVGNCCSAHAGTGCTAPTIESCVCADDSYCCDTAWDDICAGEVDSLGCGDCGGGGGTDDGAGTDDGGGTTDDGGVSDDGGGGGDCCSESAEPGCADASVESYVCAEDNYCCATAWDDICVGEVDSLGCGTCGGATTDPGTTDDGGATDAGGTDDGGGGASECCVAQPGTGCAADPEIESCVCVEDSYCCEVAWDDICAAEVESLGCGSCA